MAECIERAAAVKAVLRMRKPENSVAQNRMLSIIQMDMLKLPTADVAPVVHGRWEYTPQTFNTLCQIRCPFCAWWSLDQSIDGTYKYCPNCGAKMDGGDNDALQDATTVDAEVVVRCKDCKHYDMGVCLKIYSDGNVHPAAWQRRKPDNFCSYGERKDAGADNA